MNEKYQRAFDIGIAVMNKFGSKTKEYQLGQEILAWACERNREEQKVELIPWQERDIEEYVGSMEEKMEGQALEVLSENI